MAVMDRWLVQSPIKYLYERPCPFQKKKKNVPFNKTCHVSGQVTVTSGETSDDTSEERATV